MPWARGTSSGTSCKIIGAVTAALRPFVVSERLRRCAAPVGLRRIAARFTGPCCPIASTSARKLNAPGMIALTAIRYSGRWQGNLPFCSHRGMGWSRNGRSRAGGRAHVVNLAEPGADRGEYPSQTQCRRWGTEGAKNGAGEPGGPEFFRQKRCRLTWRCAQASSRRFRIIANRWFARLFGPGSAAPPRTPPRRQG